MILDKEVSVKITKRNIEHYKKFYKNIELRDLIKINPIHLISGSNMKINVSCDKCSTKRYIKYQAYYKNINSSKKYPIYTCDKCSHIKIRETNMEKYGVEYFSKTDEYNIKFEETMLKRYGTKHALQNKEFLEKAKMTSLDNHGVENIFMDNEKIKKSMIQKYGVDSPIKITEIRDRIKQTNLEKYGSEWILGSEKIRNNIKKTNLEKYGYVSYTKTKDFKEKSKNTNLEKYGKSHYSKTDEFKNRFKNTNISRYGSDHPLKSEILREGFQISNNPNYIKYLDGSVSLFKCDFGKDHNFQIHIDLYHSRGGYNLCTICNPIGDQKSIKEKELYKFIDENYNNEIISGYRDRYEIDIYLPELNIGIEFNGLYWHSNRYRSNSYHIDKTSYFKDKGVRIIHIWEDDWDNNKDIVKSQISNILGKSNRIYARKCEVRKIHCQGQFKSHLEKSSEFLDNNHIQGRDRSNIKLGLYYEEKLVSIMTFNKLEGRKKMKDNEYNLSRFCNKLNTSVIGGASKLFKYFINKYNPTRVISYADNDWSIGNLYEKLGFNKVHLTKPDYKYLVENKRVHKSNYRKSKTGISEKELNIPKIYDCGKLKYSYIKNPQ